MDSQKLKVLLVDDDELSRRMMGLLLSEKGYNYDTASNGLEAIEAVQSQTYGIVLMDIQMPLMNGFEATTKIREWEAQGRHVPIIALTAMLIDDEVQACSRAGMDDCIAKPFSTDRLFQVLETYLNESQGLATKKGLYRSAIEDKLEELDIKEALPRFGRDIEIYEEFLNEFIESLPERIDQFRTAFYYANFRELADKAHNLKGVAASIGAKRLSYLSQKLDRKSQDGDPHEIQKSLEEIESYANLFQNEAINILLGFTRYQEN